MLYVFVFLLNNRLINHCEKGVIQRYFFRYLASKTEQIGNQEAQFRHFSASRARDRLTHLICLAQKHSPTYTKYSYLKVICGLRYYAPIRAINIPQM